MSLDFLQDLGLTANELYFYELLLKLGQVQVHALIKQSKLKRPTVYKTLYSLEKKGLVSKKEIAKKINFQPVSPDKLLEIVETRYKNLDRNRKNLQMIMPQLISSYILSVEKPIVRTYEGLEGLKEIYIDILKERQAGYSVMQIEDMDLRLEEWLANYFTKRRVKRKMSLKVICSKGPKAERFKKRDTKEYRFTLLVPKDRFTFQHEVTIYGDKVAFIHYRKKDALIGIVIKHPQFAETMKSWFDLARHGALGYSS